AVVVVGFFVLVRAPTPEGRRLLDEIEGLRRYLGVAERQDLQRLPGPGDAAPPLDAHRFEQLLPYAVALDVEQAWTEKFTRAVGAAAAAAATASIAWFKGGRAGINDVGSFTSALGKGLTSQIASSSTPPGSGAGGGGGGFSGGGGGGIGRGRGCGRRGPAGRCDRRGCAAGTASATGSRSRCSRPVHRAGGPAARCVRPVPRASAGTAGASRPPWACALPAARTAP